MKCIQYLLVIVILALSTPAFSQDLRDPYKPTFEGPVLRDAFKKDMILLCSSNLAGSTAIYPESGSHQIVSEFKKQSKPAVWYLVIEKEKSAFYRQSTKPTNYGNNEIQF